MCEHWMIGQRENEVTIHMTYIGASKFKKFFSLQLSTYDTTLFETHEIEESAMYRSGIKRAKNRLTVKNSSVSTEII